MTQSTAMAPTAPFVVKPQIAVPQVALARCRAGRQVRTDAADPLVQPHLRSFSILV